MFISWNTSGILDVMYRFNHNRKVLVPESYTKMRSIVSESESKSAGSSISIRSLSVEGFAVGFFDGWEVIGGGVSGLGDGWGVTGDLVVGRVVLGLGVDGDVVVGLVVLGFTVGLLRWQKERGYVLLVLPFWTWISNEINTYFVGRFVGRFVFTGDRVGAKVGDRDGANVGKSVGW